MCVARPGNFMGMDSNSCIKAYLQSAKVGHQPNALILSLACCCVGLAQVGLTEPETWDSCGAAAVAAPEDAFKDDYLPCIHRPGNGIGATDEFCNLHYVSSSQLGVAPNPEVMSVGCCCNGYDGQSKDSCTAAVEEAKALKCTARPGNELNIDDDYCNDQYDSTIAKGQGPNDMIMASCCCAGYGGETASSCNTLAAKAKGRAAKVHKGNEKQGRRKRKPVGPK